MQRNSQMNEASVLFTVMKASIFKGWHPENKWGEINHVRREKAVSDAGTDGDGDVDG